MSVIFIWKLFKRSKRTLAPIWLPHWPAWRCAISRMFASLTALTLRNFLFATKSPKSRSVVVCFRYLGNADVRSIRYGIRYDMTRELGELGDKAQEIFDATRFVRIPTKSLTLRIVTRVIWLRCNSRSHGYTTRGTCLDSASVSGNNWMRRWWTKDSYMRCIRLLRVRCFRYRMSQEFEHFQILD